MMLKEIVEKSRSYRRFDESYSIDYRVLEDLITLARLKPSIADRQPLKYLIFNTPDLCSKIFPLLKWEGYLKDWNGPVSGERPSGYIIMLGDKSITENFSIDQVIAAQTIMLEAAEAGLGGCMVASVLKEELRKILFIPESYEILIVLALGKPIEEVVIEEIKNNDVRYWRDKDKIHHVPKRFLNELIVNFGN